MSQPIEPAGYNRADAQFHERDEQLVKEMRAKLDAHRRVTAEAQSRSQHWMKCPKCGGSMQEVALRKVHVDQCGSCGGVYFDAGELALLLGRDPAAASAMERLFSWLPSTKDITGLLHSKKV